MSSSVAIVTGASSGIGAAVTSRLLDAGWTVHGVSRRTPKTSQDRYIHHTVDLSSPDEVAAFIRSTTDLTEGISLLVNNAGVGYFAQHEDLSSRSIVEMVQLNLLTPLLLCNAYLRALKQQRGTIVNVASFSALESSSFGAAYAATKAGLRHFGSSLFDEVRRSGVRVVTITPDITRTPFYENLTFAPEESQEAAVDPMTVADALMSALAQPDGTVMTEVVLRPQRIFLKKGLKPGLKASS